MVETLVVVVRGRWGSWCRVVARVVEVEAQVALVAEVEAQVAPGTVVGVGVVVVQAR